MSTLTDSFDDLGFVPEVSRGRSIASAPVKGLIKGAADLGALNPMRLLSGFGAVSQQAGERATEKMLPTQDEFAENLLERAGRLAPTLAIGPESALIKALQTGGGALAGQLAEEAEMNPLGQALAEITGISLPSLGKGAAGLVKGVAKSEPETLASGLTKPQAIEARFAKAAVITPARQEKVINRLNQEASDLTKKVIEKRLPISKAIEDGIDFERKFGRQFSDVERLANRANPNIDTTPLQDLFKQSRSKYAGIPNPHPEAKKVISEINAFQKAPQNSLKNLLKIYRSNNQKLKSIYETSRVQGKQKELVDFLLDYNRSISDSIKKTLPQDSAFVKLFENTNKDYKNYQDALKTMNNLKPLTEKSFTGQQLNRLANDPKIERKLATSLGKDGAKEVVQIAKDLESAQTAIKKIPVKELNIFDSIFPLGFLIPIPSWLKNVLGYAKGGKVLKYGYGYFLSSPARKKAYQEALKSISKGDKNAYRTATIVLKRELGAKEEASEDFSDLGFIRDQQ